MKVIAGELTSDSIVASASEGGADACLLSRRTQRTGRDELVALLSGGWQGALPAFLQSALWRCSRGESAILPSRIAELQARQDRGLPRSRVSSVNWAWPIVLVRERSGDEVSYRRRAVHLGDVRSRQFWIADALMTGSSPSPKPLTGAGFLPTRELRRHHHRCCTTAVSGRSRSGRGRDQHVPVVPYVHGGSRRTGMPEEKGALD
jgi:hypothetical protein